MKLFVLGIGFSLVFIPLLSDFAHTQPQLSPIETNRLRRDAASTLRFPQKREQLEFYNPPSEPVLTIIPAEPDSYKCTTKTGYTGYSYSIKNDDGTQGTKCISRQENYELLLKQIKKKQ